MIIFSNPGQLDLRLITLHGASIKESSSPIGQFGTGLKYAIAGLLREGQGIEVFSGPQQVQFRALNQVIRGTEVPVVEMKIDDAPWQACGFTTALGAHWEPWMWYRELYANALDEGGGVAQGDGVDYSLLVSRGRTAIIVTGELLEQVHEDRADYFLQSQPLWTLPGVLEIHPASRSLICLQGIRMAAKLGAMESSVYTYNLLGKYELTEDRTLANDWYARSAIAKAILQCPIPSVVEEVLKATDSIEKDLDYDWASIEPGKVFSSVAIGLISQKNGAVNASARALLKRRLPAEVEAAMVEQVPASLSEMELGAPPLPDSYKGTIDIELRNLERALADALASAKYWRRCAQHLAQAIPYDSNPDLGDFDAP